MKNKMTRVWAAAVSAIAAIFAATIASADTPTTAPATYVFTLPPGLQQAGSGEHFVVFAPDYETVAKDGLAKREVTTRPTTMASDVLDKLAGQRLKLSSEMASDLALPEATVQTFLDGPLKSALEKVKSLHARCFVIVAREEQIRAALKAGWTAPPFHYNPLADRAVYELHYLVTTDQAPDDMVLWCQTQPDEKDDEITKTISQEFRAFDVGFTGVCSENAFLQTQKNLGDFLADKVIAPLKLPESQQWLGLGIEGAMSAKYESRLMGVSRADMVKMNTTEPDNNVIQATQLDLYHGFDTSEIKPEYVLAYMDAVRCKATIVVEKVLEKAGDTAMLEIIHSIQSTPPKDNTALVNIILSDTGVDVTNDLLPPKD
jgi:hypothetical protein